MQNIMDEDLELFIEDIGRTEIFQEVPSNVLRQYRDKVADKLLEYWDIEGFRAYGDGIVWTVNPDDYKEILKTYLKDTTFETLDNFHVFKRTAFGTLYAVGEEAGGIVTISTPYSAIVALESDLEKVSSMSEKNLIMQISFSNGGEKESFDIPDLKTNQSLFDQAYERFGMLGVDEVYAFKKRLCDGGIATISNIQVENIFDYIKEIRQSCGVPQVPFSDIKVDIDKMTVSRG